MVEIADYAASYVSASAKPSIPRATVCWIPRLRLARVELSRLHETARTHRSRRDIAERRAGSRHRLALDPVHAAFNIGALIRWLDFNDTWLAAEWGHPSDNLGAILAVADYLTRDDGRSVHRPRRPARR